MLNVCELFKSIQGESTFAGKICSFVRLAGCNLRCSYCDTSYSWDHGTTMAVDTIVKEIQKQKTTLVEITGGEPLIQDETPALCSAFLHKGYTVLIETNGTLDISRLPEGCIRIMDIKCPSSGMSQKFQYDNLAHLVTTDQCKFVMVDKSDFDWAARFIHTHHLLGKCEIVFSPVASSLQAKDLAHWILDSSLDVRLGIQLHKVIGDIL
ncbi:MAG: radical SAM protein [Chitinivibrionales bacterium]|nr:radical SAM protein [Chitinivibrionales bacterium]